MWRAYMMVVPMKFVDDDPGIKTPTVRHVFAGAGEYAHKTHPPSGKTVTSLITVALSADQADQIMPAEINCTKPASVSSSGW